MDSDTPPLCFVFISTLFQGIPFVRVSLVLLLLALSALISGSEVAFFSLNKKALQAENEKDKKIASTILKLLEKPKQLLATILVANNFINIAIVLILSSLGELYFSEIRNPIVILIVEVGIITSIILIFGEILPKIYANRNALRFSKMMAVPISFIDNYLFFWITRPMSKTTTYIEARLNRKDNQLSVDKLSQALELTSDEETTSEEQKILEGIVTFGNTDTKQVMCPRIDVFALSEAMTMEEIVPKIVEHGFSRIPVYNGKMDSIQGILYAKDLLPHIGDKSFEWQKLLKEPFYVPENKKLDDLLREFQKKKIHLAIVVDEYGGTSGVITLEDIIEEIVGDISDEFDEESLSFLKLDQGTFVFDAKISLKDFFKVIDLDDVTIFNKVRGDAETLAGLLLELIEKFPRTRQKVSHEGINFTVEEMDKKRIKTVKVELHNYLKSKV